MQRYLCMFWRDKSLYLHSGSRGLQMGPSHHMNGEEECLPKAVGLGLMPQYPRSSEAEGQRYGLSLVYLKSTKNVCGFGCSPGTCTLAQTALHTTAKTTASTHSFSKHFS